MPQKSNSADSSKQDMLRQLPGVDVILETAKNDPDLQGVPRSVLIRSIRDFLSAIRQQILSGAAELQEDALSPEAIMTAVKKQAQAAMADNLVRTINATGVVMHTNLGRSILSQAAIAHLVTIASRYSNLEFNLSTGKRGSRYEAVEDLICEISGAEAAMVVNNNAGAVLLCLDTIAKHKEVIVSRGELVEIGGSFRIPDVMARSGAILKEVGATNRTHIYDYERAINEKTGLLLKVHTSNYAIVGFTSGLSLAEMVRLGQKHQLPVMEDLGSGTFVDFSRYGLAKEPTVQESVAAGVDLITFSGDKLLGGPQAGIIVGAKSMMDKIKKNPLTRALRIDKMTLAALESTLQAYRDESVAVNSIPTLDMLTCPIEKIEHKASQLANALAAIGDPRLKYRMVESVSKAGGGSLPLLELPTKCIGIEISGISAARIDEMFRCQRPPVIGRIEEDLFLMDLRTVLPDEIEMISNAVNQLLSGV